MKKANFFDKIFGYSRFFYYLCNVRETNKDKKKILNNQKIKVMSERIKEIKSFIEGDLYNPYKGQSFKYEEYGSDGFQVICDCFTLKVDLTWGDLLVTTNKGCCVGNNDLEWFMAIKDNMLQLQKIWDEYTDVE